MLKKKKNFHDFEDLNKASSKKTSYVADYVRRNALPLAAIAIFLLIFLPASVILPKVITYEIDTSSPAVGVTSDQSASPSESKKPSDSLRIFKEHNGKVGVFFRDGKIDFIIDVDFTALSEYDRLLLEKGVIAEGSEEIALLAEGLSAS